MDKFVSYVNTRNVIECTQILGTLGTVLTMVGRKNSNQFYVILYICNQFS